MPDDGSIGQAITAAREAKGLSREELAERCGLTADKLAGIEDSGTVRLSELQQIAEALGVKLSELAKRAEGSG